MRVKDQAPDGFSGPGITLHDPAHNLENGPVTLVFFRALEAVAHWQRAERQGRFLHCAWIPCQEGHHG